ncbi:MAG: hypothetical protein JXA35_00945 [Deltaproteobacteria bacterium]|nr:hypothetical protein [Deltaproteobacteria bacterium]
MSNLDARLCVNVRLELKKLHQEIKGTIVYVTHDQVEAMTLGDKVGGNAIRANSSGRYA